MARLSLVEALEILSNKGYNVVDHKRSKPRYHVTSDGFEKWFENGTQLVKWVREELPKQRNIVRPIENFDIDDQKSMTGKLIDSLLDTEPKKTKSKTDRVMNFDVVQISERDYEINLPELDESWDI